MRDERLLHIHISWSPNDDGYVAMCVEYPSLSWRAQTRYDALEGLEGLIQRAIDDND